MCIIINNILKEGKHASFTSFPSDLGYRLNIVVIFVQLNRLSVQVGDTESRRLGGFNIQ